MSERATSASDTASTPRESLAEFDVESGGKTAAATLSVKVHTAAAARRTAWRAVGVLGIIGLVSLPIPIVHFIAPPAALLLSPLVWTLIYRLFRSGVDVSGEATCPACGKAGRLSLSLPSPEGDGGEGLRLGPATTSCSVCQAPLTLTSRRPLPR
jgi:hypothetical protein